MCLIQGPILILKFMTQKVLYLSVYQVFVLK